MAGRTLSAISGANRVAPCKDMDCGRHAEMGKGDPAFAFMQCMCDICFGAM